MKGGLWSRRVVRRTIFAVASVLIFTGLALASVTFSISSQTAGGEYAKSTGSVPGVIVQGVGVTTIPASAPAMASTSPTALTLLGLGGASHGSSYCANFCTMSDFAQATEYLITAQSTAEGFELSIGAGAGSVTVSTIVYFEVPATSPGNTTTDLVIYVDLTASSPNTSFTANLQQCSSSTSCP